MADLAARSFFRAAGTVRPAAAWGVEIYPFSIEMWIAPSGFEPLSPAPKASMLGHYTTGLGLDHQRSSLKSLRPGAVSG